MRAVHQYEHQINRQERDYSSGDCIPIPSGQDVVKSRQDDEQYGNDDARRVSHAMENSQPYEQHEHWSDQN
jgi:hypothetical protein